MDREHQGARYTTLMASDLQRDGMGLELHSAVQGQEARAVAEVFYSDAEATWTLNTFGFDVPLDIIEELMAEARRRLPPKAAAWLGPEN